MSVVRRILFGTFALAVVAATWLTLAPEQLGGPVTYVITKGNSMEPGIDEGDLILVRPAPRYEVGDVVAYRNRQLGSIVVHRIVGKTDEGFTLQGDNNTWTDSVNPTPDEMVGKPWVRIPKAGRAVNAVAEPRTAGLLAGLAVLFATAGGTARARRKRRSQGAEAPTPGRITPAHGWHARAVAGCAIVAAAAGGFATWASFAPRDRSEPHEVKLVQSGTFSYSAPAPNRTVYPSGKVTTGMPVFLKLVDTVDVRFEYRLDGPEGDYEGTARLNAVVQDEAGWRRTFPLAGRKEFRGTGTTLSGRIDFGRLRKIVSDVQHATGVVRAEYQVMLNPDVELRGVIGGAAVERDFSPVLRLRFQEEMATPLDDLDGAKNPLHPVQSGTVYVPGTAGNELSLGGVSVPVRTAQLGAVGVAGLFVLATAVSWLVLGRRRGADEPERIERQYGKWLVPVRALPVASSEVVLESFDSVVSLAEQHEQLVLHAHHEGRHRYGVHAGGITYVYSVPADPAEPLAPAAAAPPAYEPAPHVRRAVEEVLEASE